MADEPKDVLIEAAVSAFRERNAFGRILPASAWWDLAPEDREALFDRQLESRLLERAIDPDGLTSTARAVLERLG
jgi:hypothetical protein